MAYEQLLRYPRAAANKRRRLPFPGRTHEEGQNPDQYEHGKHRQHQNQAATRLWLLLAILGIQDSLPT
jgi:hypothetical protein